MPYRIEQASSKPGNRTSCQRILGRRTSHTYQSTTTQDLEVPSPITSILRLSNETCPPIRLLESTSRRHEQFRLKDSIYQRQQQTQERLHGNKIGQPIRCRFLNLTLLQLKKTSSALDISSRHWNAQLDLVVTLPHL